MSTTFFGDRLDFFALKTQLGSMSVQTKTGEFLAPVHGHTAQLVSAFGCSILVKAAARESGAAPMQNKEARGRPR